MRSVCVYKMNDYLFFSVFLLVLCHIKSENLCVYLETNKQLQSCKRWLAAKTVLLTQPLCIIKGYLTLFRVKIHWNVFSSYCAVGSMNSNPFVPACLLWQPHCSDGFAQG